MTTQNTPPAANAAPAVPEKFMKNGQPDVAALAQAYLELEKKQGAGGQPAAQSQATSPAATTTPAPDPATQTTTPAPATGDFSKFEKEFAENGKLSDASYEEIKKVHGFDKDRVDSYIRFQQAEAESYAKNVTDVAGGVDAYKQMATWAAQNYNEADAKAFDTAIKSGNINAAKLAVSELKTKYEAANGRDPKLVGGNTSGGVIMPFQSLNEAVAFRSNPKYKTDPNYQREYMQRLAVSKL